MAKITGGGTGRGQASCWQPRAGLSTPSPSCLLADSLGWPALSVPSPLSPPVLRPLSPSSSFPPPHTSVQIQIPFIELFRKVGTRPSPWRNCLSGLTVSLLPSQGEQSSFSTQYVIWAKGQPEDIRMSKIVSPQYVLQGRFVVRKESPPETPHDILVYITCPWASYFNLLAHLFTICTHYNQSTSHNKATQSIFQHWALKETSHPGTCAGKSDLWPVKHLFSICQH